MTVREGRWRCPYCAAVNRGAESACGGCGATRDKDVTFFLEADAPPVEDLELLRRARAGAEWLCLFCQTANPAPIARCAQCGAERGTAPARSVRELPATPPPPVAPAAATAPPRRGCGTWLLLLLLLLGGAVLWRACAALRQTQEAVSVAGFEWSRSVRVESLRQVRESAWAGEVPGDARVLRRTRAVHHEVQRQVGTRRVKVGVRDLGNGFFEDVYADQPVYRSEPVYRERVEYEVPRWVATRELELHGSDRQPRWPEVALGRGERLAGQKERYVALLQGRRLYRLELPEERWRSLAQGARLRALVQGGTHVRKLE